MKPIEFKPFAKFKKMVIVANGEKTLYYGRTFGNMDWGFIITGHFNKKWDKVPTGNLDGNGNPIYEMKEADFIQVQFLTNDIVPYFDKQKRFVPLPSANKTMYLKGVTNATYLKVCEWIEQHRKNLLDSVTELKGEYNLFADVLEEQGALNAN